MTTKLSLGATAVLLVATALPAAETNVTGSTTNFCNYSGEPVQVSFWQNGNFGHPDIYTNPVETVAPGATSKWSITYLEPDSTYRSPPYWYYKPDSASSWVETYVNCTNTVGAYPGYPVATHTFSNASQETIAIGYWEKPILGSTRPKYYFVVTNLQPNTAWSGIVYDVGESIVANQYDGALYWRWASPPGGTWSNSYYSVTADFTYGGGTATNSPHASANDDPNAWTEEPINTINGAVGVDETDIAISCPGLPLVFGRHYNSGLDYSGPLGWRWTHTFDRALSSTNYVESGATNTYRVLREGQGSVAQFRWNGTNYAGAFGSAYQLVLTNGEHQLTAPGGLVSTFDTNGVFTSVTDPFQNRLTLTYSNAYPSHLLTRVEHNNGQYLSFSYQSNLLAQVNSPTSTLYVSFEYNGQNELTSAQRHQSSNVYSNSYLYDASAGYWNHSLTQKVNAAGETFAYGYLTNGSGQTTSWGSRMVLQTNLYEHSVSYDTNLNITTVTYARNGTNQVYQYSIDPFLQRTYYIHGVNADNREFDYSAAGDVTRTVYSDSTLWGSIVVQSAFDSRHNVTSSFSSLNGAASNVWLYAWNTNWNVPTGITDPEGHKVGMEYTNASVCRVKLYYNSSDSWDTTLGYADNGLLASLTNANGHWVAFCQDAYGNTTSMVPQLGPSVKSTFTSLGHLQKVELLPYTFFADTSDPGSTNGVWLYRTTSFDVNELGWVSKTTYPDPDTGCTNGPSEYFHRDVLGNVTNHVDIAGRSTLFTWLPTRKLSSATRTLNGTNVATSMTYDNQFNTLVIRDALDRAVESYALDLQDRPVTVTNLENQTMSISYGVGDYVRRITRFDGTTVSNVFNGDGWVSATHYPGATNTFAYLKNGLLSKATNSLGSVSNSWSFANRLTSQSQIAPSGTVSYAQDPAGNVTGLTSVAGTQMSSFDAGERLAHLQSSTLGFDFSYNTNNGLVSSVVCTNSGIGVTYQMDAWDRVKNIAWTNSAGTTLQSFAYTYSSTGTISSVGREDGSYVVYGYDGLDRLIGETQIDDEGNTNLDVSLSYDLAGNRTAKTRDGIAATFTNGPGNRLAGWSCSATNTVATFDVSGYANENIGTGERYGQLWVSNSTAKVTPTVAGSNFYAFGFQGPLGTQQFVAAICDIAGNTTFATSSVCIAVVTNAAYGYSPAGCVTSILYSGASYSQGLAMDWNGLYQLTSVKTNGAAIESYGYDPMGRRAYVASGTTTNWLVWDGWNVIAEVNGSGQLQKSYTWGGTDRLLALTVYSGSTGTVYTALTDYLGTVHALANTNGVIVESYRFDAHGRVLDVFDGSGQPISQSALGNSVLWGGKFYSWKVHAVAGAGFYYNRMRYYDAVTGRFLSRDPIGISGGLHETLYCYNNPVNFVDPLGLDVFLVGASSKDLPAHQKIVLEYTDLATGQRAVYASSFGARSKFWATVAMPIPGTPTGAAYADDPCGPRLKQIKLTQQQEYQVLALLVALEGQTAHYNLRTQCRKYSQSLFDKIAASYPKSPVIELPACSGLASGKYDDGAAVALGVYTTVRTAPHGPYGVAAAVGSVVGGGGVSSTESSNQ